MKIKKEMLNASIRDIPLPDMLLERPLTKTGFPVPFFAARHPDTDEWDLRVVYPETRIRCMRQHLCWVCGNQMGRRMVFVAGPMCVVTRTSSEPPCHLSCAQYSAIACPFLSQPRMRRNDKDLPSQESSIPGIGIMRNPGVAAVLITDKYTPFNDGKGDVLIRMGDPIRMEWYAQRRKATRDEVMQSIESGLQLLHDECEREDTVMARKEAHEMLAVQVASALQWLPPADAKSGGVPAAE